MHMMHIAPFKSTLDSCKTAVRFLAINPLSKQGPTVTAGACEASTSLFPRPTQKMSDGMTAVKADYSNPAHAKAIETLIQEYALDPMGGGEALKPEVLTKMVSELAKRPYAFTILSYSGDTPTGLCNCFECYSTFSGKGIVNIHDCCVSKDFRGKGISQLLLQGVEEEARARGAGKLTLEVLENNKPAHGSYSKFGFAPYELDPAMGKAMFWQKALK